MDGFEIIDNESKWKIILRNFKNVDCYYSFEYGSLFAKKEVGKLLAAYYEDSESKIFYPFIRRVVPYVEDKAYDIVTPYGYGGPLINGNKESIHKFYENFNQYCQLNQIITETIRFHPLLKNYMWCRNILDLEYIRQTTAVDLNPSLEEIKNNYTSMNKRNIRKSLKNNLRCFVAENNKENINIFMDLYNETMDRNHASRYYYFDEKYFFEQVKETEISQTYLLFTSLRDEVIAGVMIMIGQEYGHYHLGASKTKYLDLKPNNLLFDFMIEFCKLKGLKSLHLGGGYQENDGLFKFKTSFTNNNNLNYYLGKKIHNPKLYNKIIEYLEKSYLIDQGFFPIYRGQKQRRQELGLKGGN